MDIVSQLKLLDPLNCLYTFGALNLQIIRMDTDPNFQDPRKAIALNAKHQVLIIIPSVGARMPADRAAHRGTNALDTTSTLSSLIP